MTDTTNQAAGAQRRPRGHAAHKLFFPAAALYAAVAVPLSVHGLVSGQPLLPGFGGIAGHAHELLFGFALAVVSGFLINKTSAYRLSALFSLWLIARASYLLIPGGLVPLIANVAFAVMLVWLTVPQFVRGAKKWRNQAIAPILIALAATLALFHLPRIADLPWLRFVALEQGVAVLALLMLFMGGRIIAPAVGSAIERAGGRQTARVQPYLEATLLILMAGLIITLAIPGARVLAGGFALAAAVVALIRLVRWRLWAAAGRPDLWCLGVGMAWLGVGLGLLGVAWATDWLAPRTMTHAITVGALGTLTTGVMARVRLNGVKRNPAESRLLPLMTALIAAATICRLLFSHEVTGLVLASGFWAAAYALLLLLLARSTSRSPKPAA